MRHEESSIDKSYMVVYVCGQSMFPALRHADRILIKRTPLQSIKNRDILVYKGTHHPISHRVIKIVNTPTGLVFYTKGDYSGMREKITGERIVGKVVGVYRNERLKSLSFESSFLYYLFITMLSLIKEALKKIIETLFSWALIRATIKSFFSLEARYLLVEDEEGRDDFKSFCNFYPFPSNQYFFVGGFLAKCKNNPIGKIWILNDRDGKVFLFGPYVKVLYRARGVGVRLIREALGYIKIRGIRDPVYAFPLPGNGALLKCFKKLGFSLAQENSLLFYKHKC
jgi:signal peptidase I